MSEYRDGLIGEQQAVYDRALSAAAETYAEGWVSLWERVAAEGPRAVAEAVWYPGHPLGTVDAIEARLRGELAPGDIPLPAALERPPAES